MHARDLVDLAALVAIHSRSLIRGPGGVPPACIQEYWAASRCRLDRWTRLLRKLAGAQNEFPPPATLAWPRVRPVLEEIIASEVLSRIWTAIGTAYDHQQGHADELAPIARNILAGHLDARRQVLSLLANNRLIPSAQAGHLNHLRRRIERWCDMLLAHVDTGGATTELAFEPDRARDFADDLAGELASESLPQNRQFTCGIILGSLRASLRGLLADRAANADLNRRIGVSVVSCFGEQLALAPGLVKSMWLERMMKRADDAQGMIDQLVLLDLDQA